MLERSFADLPNRRQQGRCPRCMDRPTAVVIRLFAQDRPVGKPQGKTLASSALSLCEPCAVTAFERADEGLRSVMRTGLPVDEPADFARVPSEEDE